MIMLCFGVQMVVVFHETSRVMVGMIAVMAVTRIAELIVVRSYSRANCGKVLLIVVRSYSRANCGKVL